VSSSIYGEWHRRDAEMRDDFQVEDDAEQRFWLFRAGDGENTPTGSQAWFLRCIRMRVDEEARELA
jgi:protein ImuB